MVTMYTHAQAFVAETCSFVSVHCLPVHTVLLIVKLALSRSRSHSCTVSMHVSYVPYVNMSLTDKVVVTDDVAIVNNDCNVSRRHLYARFPPHVTFNNRID